MKTQLKVKQKLVLGSLVAILVISSFMYMPALADSDDDEDDDGIEDEIEDENEREVHVEYSENEVKIESSIENNGIENEFQIKVKTEDEGLKFKLEFEEENDTLETEIEFQVKFSEIVEFRDLNADGIYNDSDEVIQVLELSDWNPIVYTVETINNATVHVLFVETTDEVFTATLYATGEFADIEGVVVAPTQVKVDVGIHNFNYTELDTQLALKVELESELEVDYEDNEETEDEKYGHAENEHEIEVSLDEYSAFFSWIETAMVDGVEVDVKVTPLEMDFEENKMYLNYPRGTEIIHDPKVGLSNLLVINTSFLGNNNFLFITAAAVLTLTGLVLVFRKRFKR
ncbi:MAG: hypothetical protein ACTSQF_06805 [Candidatus Heimdallarchaeaceae archaeon]